jgi:hypothetical protein
MEGEWNKNERLVAIISCISPFPVVKERKEDREREREREREGWVEFFRSRSKFIARNSRSGIFE